ncbi:hypothetical protein M413DRAFT_441413 [Hebeloma cylindrosporum]|uniref:BTB domain-containing protein n=1 Tax=Hebeloma cylindrosporum TaxID=76867 RepID=A0A0C3CC05_HEBCY|nr:hypothetical protein M413DRAFT_441413 [Hebeloma cylindrosporum h7]
MSEHLRLSSSPASSSPGRLPSISRPDWPWAARSYSQRSQQSSPHPSNSTVQGSNLHSGWDPRASFSSNSGINQSNFSGNHQARHTTPKPLTSSTMGFLPGETTRQWSFTGFEWAIRDVSKLRDFVEGVVHEDGSQTLVSEAGEFEVLKQSPILGDHKFKLEIAPTVVADGSAASTPNTLSLYITSLMLDYAQGDYETSASMMAAIKCQDDRVGERGARPEWIWEFWQNDWVFRRESEVWECPLPSLTHLLENPRVRDTDSLVICVQIHCPVGPTIPQQPSVYYVPRDLLDGLESSLDNPNTGDVRFVCLEKYASLDGSITLDASSSAQSTTSTLSDSISPFGSHAIARKRIIYAHSDILIRRSEYFATMLSSSFAENSAISTGERKLYTIVVEEADFETIYWLLKYCYANWLLFKQDDDPRLAVEGVGAGWSARWLSGHQGEWDWKTFNKRGPGEDETGDNRSATSGESLPLSSAVSRSTSRKSDTYHPNPVQNNSSTSAPVARTSPAKPSAASTIARPTISTASSSRRTATVHSTSNPVTINVGGSSPNLPRIKPSDVPGSSTYPSSPQYPVSPRTNRHPTSMVSSSDPHPHPTPAPAPASALSIYQVAHRYIMPNLASLALEHIMSTITPQSSFALLLATSSWDELHPLVEDYVVERWDEVSASAEFEHCCKEVAGGEWGPDGGNTLMSVFRRLRSPASMGS